MSTKSLATILAGLCAGLLIALVGTRTEVSAQATPKGCAQWEVTLGAPSTVAPLRATTDALVAEPAPAGWEPFAYLPSGQLSYRRCAK